MFQGLPPLETPLPGQAQGPEQPQTVPAEQSDPVQTPKPEPMDQSEAGGEATKASGKTEGDKVEAKMEVLMKLFIVKSNCFLHFKSKIEQFLN